MKGNAANLTQVGPFTFEKKLTRDIEGFSEDHLEINVVTKAHFYFRPDLSNMDAFDKNVTVVNAPLAVSMLPLMYNLLEKMACLLILLCQ